VFGVPGSVGRVQEVVQGVGAGGFVDLPGENDELLGEVGGLPDIAGLAAGLDAQAVVLRAGAGEALVENPGARGQSGSFQIFLEAFGLVYGRGFGKGDEEDAGVGRIPQFGEEVGDLFGEFAPVAQDFAVVGLGGVEQEQGVAGGGGVEYDESVSAVGDGAGEGLENGDLFGAGGAEFLFEKFAPRVVEVGARGVQHVLDVSSGLLAGVDAGDFQIGKPLSEGLGHMCGGIGGGKMDGMSAGGQSPGDGGGEGGFADASLAHGEDHAGTVGFELVDEGCEVEMVGQFGWRAGFRGLGRVGEEFPEGGRADESARAEGASVLREIGQGGRKGLEAVSGALGPGTGEWVVAVFGLEHAVDHEAESVDALFAKFVRRAGGFPQRAAFGSAYHDDPSAVAIPERLQGAGVGFALFLESGEGAEAGGPGFVVGDKVVPGGGEREQPEGVSGGSGVEHDVVVGVEGVVFADEAGEFVEGGDFDGAGAGELFLDVPEAFLGQDAAQGIDHAGAVTGGGLQGIDVHGLESVGVGDGGGFHVKGGLQDLVEVGGGVGADEQHAFSGVGEGDGGGAGEGGFSHAAFAGKEEDGGWIVQPVSHPQHPSESQAGSVSSVSSPRRRANWSRVG